MHQWPIDAVQPHLVALRRELHRHPELAFQEVETARIVMSELDRLGIKYRYDGAGSAVVGELTGGSGPAVALRAELDALPGEELTDLPFRSVNPARMHACGHDAHMSMVLGAAALLKQRPPPGRVLFVFQPAEERGGGARTVRDSGVLDDVVAIFAGHVTQEYAVGEIMVSEGVITAQSDGMTVRVKGRGGHGARPHEATDAIVVASLFIIALQTLVSRETNPFHPTVITIGRIQGGSAANMIAEDALLEGSIRTTLPAARSEVLKGIKRMAKAMGDLHHADVSVEIREGYPPVINPPRETEVARRAARAVVGEAGLVRMEHASMGSEDFAFYLQRIPGCYVRFGARLPDREPVPLHSPQFTVNEDVLQVGAAYLAQVAHEAVAEHAADGA